MQKAGLGYNCYFSSNEISIVVQNLQVVEIIDQLHMEWVMLEIIIFIVMHQTHCTFCTGIINNDQKYVLFTKARVCNKMHIIFALQYTKSSSNVTSGTSDI
ncbi:MAG: hypothetical protein CM15mV9_2520 [uncultured marine virus]|nr:MAG: hypothetical protein CM15mV9_2520 [uncultured marine virus]